MSFRKSLSLLLILVLVVLSVSVVSAQGDLGSEDNPIKMYFVPSVTVDAIVSGGDVMADALKEATGLNFEVFVPTSYAATIEEMCASPDDSIGFIPAFGYVLANDRCGVEVGVAAVRFGWPVYFTEYIVRRDSGIYTVGDLEGKTWGYPSTTSTSGYLIPAGELGTLGITPGEGVEFGGSHTSTVRAVYNGEVDFGTVFFSPPLTPGAPWQIGDPAEPYDLSMEDSYINDSDQLFVGDIRVLDARQTIREEAPDVVDQVRILRVSQPIPNDTLSFGADFPDDLRTQILDALAEFVDPDSEACQASICSPDFYEWTGVAVVGDDAFDPIRDVIETLGMTEDDIFN